MNEIYFDYKDAVAVEVEGGAGNRAWVVKKGNFYCDRQARSTTWLPAARKHESLDAALWEIVNQQLEMWHEVEDGAVKGGSDG